uniref:FHA domain-containing protein n=1 Tax=Gasterosteus aculeatus aculeatus TaxID=481459 RepID=A0AAQ4QI54_GASAC
MDSTQILSDSILESDEEENKGEIENKRGDLTLSIVLWHTEMPLFLGDNVLGRDPSTCTVPLPAPSISKQHATICISALIWDRGSMNGTRKGHLKLTPNVHETPTRLDIHPTGLESTLDSETGDGAFPAPAIRE